MIIERQEILNAAALHERALNARITDLEAENKALRERIKREPPTIDNYLRAMDERARLAQDLARERQAHQKAEAALAQHIKNEDFLRQQADNWEARSDKLEAACAELRSIIEQQGHDYADDTSVICWSSCPRCLLAKVKTDCGKDILDRLKAMEEICESCPHDHKPIAGGYSRCSKNCAACRWEAMKEGKR